MKLNFGKKLVLFLHWLLSLIVFALVLISCAAPQLAADIPEIINRLLGAGLAEIAGIAILALYALLAVLSVVFIFSGKKRRVDRSFITVDNSDAGRTRIAIGAVEQMIRQAVRGVEGIVEMKSSITNLEDAISINSTVSIASGAHVPTVTMNIQRAVRSYIELNCGVAVREVCVSVNSLESGEDGGKKRGRGHAPLPAAVQAYEPVQAPVTESAPVQNIVPAEEPAPEVKEPSVAEEAESAAEAGEATE